VSGDSLNTEVPTLAAAHGGFDAAPSRFIAEWAQPRTSTKRLVWIGVAELIGATAVIGAGNYLSTRPVE
jgi:hypothetical protein